MARTHRGVKLAPPTRETHEQATMRMLNDPLSWPNLVLPLKKPRRSGDLSELAILACSLARPYVYKIARGANLFNQESWNFVDTTVEEVLREGWLVD